MNDNPFDTERADSCPRRSPPAHALVRRVVEALTFGIVEVDDDWRVGYANPAAAILLLEDAALSADAGRIRIRPDHTFERARRWLAQAAAGGKAAMAVARADGAPPFLLEYLSPLTSAAGSAMHLLAMLDAGQPPSVDADRLALAYGLTRAEARLVAAIADGQTLQAVAQRQDVNVSTLRTHLESVYAKTGARRQAQVVRLAMACAAPFDRGAPPSNSGVERAYEPLAAVCQVTD